MKRRRVDDEHCQAGTTQDTREIPPVRDDLTTEWNFKLGLDGEHIKALSDENGQVDYRLGLTDGFVLLRPSNYLAVYVGIVWAAVGKVAASLLRAPEIHRRETMFVEYDEIRNKRSNHLNYTSFQVRVAQQFTINQGFIFRFLKEVFPEKAGERGLDFRDDTLESRGRDDLHRLWITDKCFRPTKGLLLAG